MGGGLEGPVLFKNTFSLDLWEQLYVVSIDWHNNVNCISHTQHSCCAPCMELAVTKCGI